MSRKQSPSPGDAEPVLDFSSNPAAPHTCKWGRPETSYRRLTPDGPLVEFRVKKCKIPKCTQVLPVVKRSRRERRQA